MQLVRLTNIGVVRVENDSSAYRGKGVLQSGGLEVVLIIVHHRDISIRAFVNILIETCAHFVTFILNY